MYHITSHHNNININILAQLNSYEILYILKTKILLLLLLFIFDNKQKHFVYFLFSCFQFKLSPKSRLLPYIYT